MGSTYWSDREKANAKSNLLHGVAYEQEVNKIYNKMLADAQKEINAFYARYAKSENLTLQEAQKRISKADMEYLAKKAEKYVKDREFSKQANEEMRLYNATMKINRLEMLKSEIGHALVDGHNDIEKLTDDLLKDQAYREFKRQAGILGESIFHNEQMVDSIVNASYKNATWSDRLWANQSYLKKEIDNLVRSGLIAGKNPRTFTGELVKKFDVSKGVALRLAVTEMTRVQTESQKLSFERNGYDEFIFISCEDRKTCAACSGLDGKHFKVKDMEIGVNAPPVHPSCRCSTAAHVDEEKYNEWLDGYKKHGLSYEKWLDNHEKKKYRQYSTEARKEQQKDPLGRNVYYKTGGQNLFDYAREKSKNPDAFPTIEINDPQEWAILRAALNSHLTKADRKRKVITKSVGDYVYTVQNYGYDDYRVIGKDLIEDSSTGLYERVFNDRNKER